LSAASSYTDPSARSTRSCSSSRSTTASARSSYSTSAPAQLTDGGRLLFLADAIYDDFYVPWGVRLDGAAAFMAAQQGWLELGFRRDFFEAELAARGFTSTWDVLGWLGPYGTVLVADRTSA